MRRYNDQYFLLGKIASTSHSSHSCVCVHAQGLAVGMEVKHATYNTGFSGAKLVCASATPVSEWNDKDKTHLMNVAASLLEELDGARYTGCDMNVTTKDMDYLSEKCPYVLAAVGNDATCPNKATAYGVLGAVEATLGGSVEGKKLLVHGCGGVGAYVAAELVELGAASVKTVDMTKEKADIAGCVNVSGEEWWKHDVDALVPCSSSGLLTEEVVEKLKCGSIVGATNIPFETRQAQSCAEDKGVLFVPEGISSAGAVIVDSVEFYDHGPFVKAEPQSLYDFTRAIVKEKTSQLLVNAARLNVPPSLVVPLVAEGQEKIGMTPVGARFSKWCAANQIEDEAFSSSRFKASQNARVTAPISLDARFDARLATDFVSKPTSVSYNASLAASRAAPSAARAFTTSAVGSKRSFCTGARPGSQSDVVIVGGGIMGLNIAYQLRRRDPSLSVTILERAAALGNGSSGYSTGFQRAYYSFDETMQFALDGIEAYKNWNDYLQDSSAHAKFTETGALWMLGYDQKQNDEMQARLTKFGVASDVLDAAGLAAKYPLMSSEPYPTFNEEGDLVEVDHGKFSAVFEHGCGHIDSSTCLEDLKRACVRDGTTVRMNTRVKKFVTGANGRCTGVELEDGSLVEAGVAVVNASGPWFNKLNDTVGVKLSTEALPTRIQVGHKWIPDEYCNLPFVADGWGPSGIYFMPRAANNQLVFGSVAHRFESEIVDPDDYNTALDPDVKQDYLQCLFHRLPGLPHEGEIVGFSSMYTVNQDDVHPMIGETEVKGLWACNGFSGHGFKLAPAVGSLVAQQITGSKTNQWETDVPHDFMGPYREALTLKVKTHFA